MKLILLSGGSGKRLWPLSNDNRSKQFIKVMHNDNEGEGPTSMIQRVWASLQKMGLAESAVIAASQVQEEVIQSQLNGAAHLVLEPVKRDTFPAISLASTYLFSKMGVNEGEIVVVMPVDVEADDSFFEAIKQLGKEFEESDSNIGLIGLRPTSPSEKFGYILPRKGLADSGMLQIDRFIEKPDSAAAERLIKQGAMWNCGVFAFRLGYMLELLRSSGWSTDYEKMIANYHLMPSISFDYEVVEKEQNVSVKPYSGRWNDLGTWNEWTSMMPRRLNGKGVLSEDSINTHIVNELQIPVVVLGIPNAVIAASPDGILVSDKESSTKLKDAVKSLSARPMYEETIYGWYRVMDCERNGLNQQVVTKRVHVWTGKHISYHVHTGRDEIWTIIGGKAEIMINGRKFQAGVGEVIHIESGIRHAIRAIEAVDLIEVQIGMNVNEDDIIRYEFDWQVGEQRKKGRKTI
ncbi:cupin domain-containing protein [Paenibacillus sp. 1011MAR3C5]|uniref:sugar phosphate nucleotidyltransferase n=1 Tax=Paenibacillus sp. 1011MAR3C5 TaxID=1675787 RepID=UPI000E6C8830|nr:sugar phosphate nucleotidyltransferase [Paenibacillus sp. 1011MAR3C5]RJE83953.1 cupin domain-containing protein [Paenibacillus sp. 1011MAR3C5]